MALNENDAVVALLKYGCITISILITLAALAGEGVLSDGKNTSDSGLSIGAS